VWKDFGTIVEYSPVGNEKIKIPEIQPKLQAYAANGILQVSGLVVGETLIVYNFAGKVVCSIIAKSETEQIPLKEHGVYIIVSGNHSIKAVVK
jgi:hypothetical protein